MKVTLNIEYRTDWGESLAFVADDCRYPMSWSGNNIWSITFEDCNADLLADYTYVVLKDGILVRSEWQHHSCKMAPQIFDLWIDAPKDSLFPRRHSARIFDRSGFRGAGTAVPVFSLRSKNDFGIGDFRDLRLLVDWAAKTGQCVIQLLPINDTTRDGSWKDSFPYSPISSFALHPMYIRLQDLGVKEDETFLTKQRELNALKEIDYPKVFEAKMGYMREAFQARGAGDMASMDFVRFRKRNEGWLEEYAAFCAERDSLPKAFYLWVQFHLDKQLSEEVEYAHQRGISLKGDLPIGVSRDSVECHTRPQLFNLDSNAGAPPDQFSDTGQDWGFPTYNWDEMAKDGYAWWKARLRKMAEYFDAFRIDHILGFFRIWEIPHGSKSALDGHFNPALSYPREEIESASLPIDGLFNEDPHRPGFFQPRIRPARERLSPEQKERFDAMYEDFYYRRNNDFWRENALRKLPELLNATGMLACGEDLGMVPDCVRGVMQEQAILSLHMRGMEQPGEWQQMSVCSTSSHDMPTLRMQFEEDPPAWKCCSLLWQYLDSPSLLVILPLQDWLSLDGTMRCPDRNAERINDPSNQQNRWNYRIHFPLEKLSEVASRNLNSIIAKMVEDSRRR